jgi:hypothetical protein
MLRMRLAAADLGRISMTVRPHPLWELVLSLHVLQARIVPAPYVTWRDWVLRMLAGNDSLCERVRRLTTLVPPTGDFPDFLTPDGSGGFADLLEAVLATPRARLTRELAGARTPWVRSLAGGDADAMRDLGTALTHYHGACVAPYWEHVEKRVTAERELRVRILLSGGSEQLLHSLPGPIRWIGDALVADYPVHHDVPVAGRGLTLVPAFFCWHQPVSLVDADLPPVLVYPIDHPDDDIAHAHSSAGLAALLGPTRARMLRVLRTPSSTTEIARHVGISVGSASRQATVLREAGLITSVRHEKAVVHALTHLGHTISGSAR